jgi:recA bacterial DNA recombination protein
MSASPVLSSAAIGRPFIFPALSSPSPNAERIGPKTADFLSYVGTSSKLAAVVPASRLDVRPAPEIVSSGIPQLDSLTGGFARGCLTEICGEASAGRTSVLLFALARATQRGEVCALVDTSDAFDPSSAAAAGMEMNRLLWVRCGEKSPSQRVRKRHNFTCTENHQPSLSALAAEAPLGLPFGKFPKWKNSKIGRWEQQLAQMLKVTDLLLQSNGFGMIALDLGDVPERSARRIPLASWFRFRRVIEHTPTVLLILEQQPIAGSCSSALLKVSGVRSDVSGKKCSASPLSKTTPTHAGLLDQFEITVELLRSRLEQKMERKPVQSTATFKSRAAWAVSF